MYLYSITLTSDPGKNELFSSIKCNSLLLVWLGRPRYLGNGHVYFFGKYVEAVLK